MIANKINLKYETPTTHIVEYNDWDSFIRENFPDCPYEGIVPEEQMYNYTSYTHKSREMEQVKRLKVLDYLSGQNRKKFDNVCTGEIIDLLVSYEDIPKGVYIISIFW